MASPLSLPTHPLIVTGGRKEFIRNTRSNDAVILRCSPSSRVIVHCNQRLTGIVGISCHNSELIVLDSAVISSRSLRLVDCENLEIYCEDVDLRRIELFRCRGCTITVVGDDVLLSVMYVLTREGCANNTFCVGEYLPSVYLPPSIWRNPLLTVAIPDSVNGHQFFTTVPYRNKILSLPLVVDNALTEDGALLQTKLSPFTLPTMFRETDSELLFAPNRIPTAEDVLAAVTVLEQTPYNVTAEQIEEQYDLERRETFEEAAQILPKVREVVGLL
jgi:hypothetical protein